MFYEITRFSNFFKGCSKIKKNNSFEELVYSEIINDVIKYDTFNRYLYV